MKVKQRTLILLIFIFLSLTRSLIARPLRIPIPNIDINVKEASGPKDVSMALQIIFLLSILTLAPSIIMMTTSYIRIVVVFELLKRALSTQQLPPNQIIAGLAIFLTFFIMTPTIKEINEQALQPYLGNEISSAEFFSRGIKPLRAFMFKQTSKKDIGLMIKLSKGERPKNRDDVSTAVLIPAFMISELKRGFEIGILLFIPFIIIDMVVASTLMSMGMIMLPPVMISLPLKIILFVLVDGWNLITYELVRSFH